MGPPGGDIGMRAFPLRPFLGSSSSTHSWRRGYAANACVSLVPECAQITREQLAVILGGCVSLSPPLTRARTDEEAQPACRVCQRCRVSLVRCLDNLLRLVATLHLKLLPEALTRTLTLLTITTAVITAIDTDDAAPALRATAGQPILSPTTFMYVQLTLVDQVLRRRVGRCCQSTSSCSAACCTAIDLDSTSSSRRSSSAETATRRGLRSGDVSRYCCATAGDGSRLWWLSCLTSALPSAKAVHAPLPACYQQREHSITAFIHSVICPHPRRHPRAASRNEPTASRQSHRRDLRLS